MSAAGSLRGDAMTTKQFLIYDMRAMHDTDDAIVYACCTTLKQARQAARSYTPCCIYEYDVVDNELTNEQFVEIVGVA